jgi:hypothetical protein
MLERDRVKSQAQLLLVYQVAERAGYVAQEEVDWHEGQPLQ